MKDLSYFILTPTHAKVTCTCGWESAPFNRSPFDPAEALAGFQVEHLKCNESPPEVYYAVAREIHGKLIVLGELLPGPESKAIVESICHQLVPKESTMKVVEVRVILSVKG